MKHRAKRESTYFRAEDKKLTLRHKFGGEESNKSQAAEGSESQREEEDGADSKWRIDGQEGMFAVIEGDYCLKQDGKTILDSICVATPTAKAHEPVSGALTRYGDV